MINKKIDEMLLELDDGQKALIYGNLIMFDKGLPYNHELLLDAGLLDYNGDWILKYPLYDEVQHKIDDSNLDLFIDEYRMLFTVNGKSIKPGIKGDGKDIKRKFIKLFKENKHLDRTKILEVTKSYIDRMLNEGKKTYITQADYFILKDNRSMLLALYEDDSIDSDVNYDKVL